MRKPLTFFELQSTQKEHDHNNHSDISTLPLFDRINHYVLHYAKYTARLTHQKGDVETERELKRTYTDAFLISLSASNALNMDLDVEMRKRFTKVARDIADYALVDRKMNVQELRVYSRDSLAISNGAMANTLEKRDHMDDLDSRSILIENLSEIAGMIISGSGHLDFDIVEASLERRRKIADLRIT
ncbi:MAG: hypothetical protein Q8Q31_01315 [Nanoarchaeota archaeon]|nr:hypothetical protein [Nanoarchaeota archaeon]